LGAAATLRRVRAFAARTTNAAADVAAELRERGGHRSVVDRIVETVAARGAQLERELS
jgi:hypothetical protein